MANPSMKGIASVLASKGRGGDTMLMHVAPEEVQYLTRLGGITENPDTGLPEALKFKDFLPYLGSAFLGPAFKAVGFSPTVSSILASTAGTMLGGGSLEKGIMSGLVSSSLGRLGTALSPEASKAAAADTGYRFGIFKKPAEGGPRFGERYAEAFRSPQFNPIEAAKSATEGGLDKFITEIQKPSVMIPFTTGAGELARMSAAEKYQEQMAEMQRQADERRRRVYARNPQVLPPSSPYYRPPGMKEGGLVERKQRGRFPLREDVSNVDTMLPSGENRLALTQQPSTADVERLISEQEIQRQLSAVIEQQRLEREAAAQAEAERMAREEFARQEAARRAEAELVAREQAAAREASRQAEEARLAREAEAARVAEEQARTRRQEEAARAEAQRVAAEQARLAEERQQEAARIQAQQAEAARLEEARVQAQQAEAASLAELAAQEQAAIAEESNVVTPMPGTKPDVAPTPSINIFEEGFAGEQEQPTEEIPQSSLDFFTRMQQEQQAQLEPNPYLYGFAGTLGAISGAPGLPSPAAATTRSRDVTAPVQAEQEPITGLTEEQIDAIAETLLAQQEAAAAAQPLVSEEQILAESGISAEQLAQAEQALRPPERQDYLERISELMKNNQFEEAFNLAKEADKELGFGEVGTFDPQLSLFDNLVNPDKMRYLRGPMTVEEIQAYYKALPKDELAKRYGGDRAYVDIEGAIAANLEQLGGQAGYVNPFLGLKQKESELGKIIDKIVEIAPYAFAATVGAGLLGDLAAAGGAAAGGTGTAAGTTAGVTGGAAAATAPVAATVATAAGAIPMAEITVLASKLALSVPQVVSLIGSAGLAATQAMAGTAPVVAATQPTVTQPSPTGQELEEYVVQSLRKAPPPDLATALASTGIGQGTQDILSERQIQETKELDAEIERQIQEGKIPEEPLQTFEVITGLPQLSVTDIIPGLATQLAQAGYRAPLIEGQAVPKETLDAMEEIIVRGQPPAAPIDLAGITGGLTAAEIAQGFMQPRVDPLSGELREPIEELQSPATDPSLIDRLTELAKGAGEDYLQSQALSALLSGLAGGAVGGVGAGTPGYQGTGGLGYIPEGQERRYISAEDDYQHGFLPEWMFFENLNPPAVIETSYPGTTPGGERGEVPGDGGGFDDTPVDQNATGGMIMTKPKVFSPRDYLEMVRGYQVGGLSELPVGEVDSGRNLMTDGNKDLIDLTRAVILGEVEERADEIIQKFIDLYGYEEFQNLRDQTLDQMAPGSLKTGLVRGQTGGMDDMVDGVIGSQERVAVSPGEFIVPADVVAALGDGNTEKGGKELEKMMERTRLQKYGSNKQPPPVNLDTVMPA